MKSRTWRDQFEDRPLTMLALAFGGGLVLASMGSRRTRGGVERAISRGVNHGNWRGARNALFSVLSASALRVLEDTINNAEWQKRR